LYSEVKNIFLLKYELNISINNPQTNEENNVILKAEDIKFLNSLSSSLYSEIYFVIPKLIPPEANVNAIAEKLYNCPNKAIPEGPMIIATTFTLIKPVNIFTIVDKEV